MRATTRPAAALVASAALVLVSASFAQQPPANAGAPAAVGVPASSPGPAAAATAAATAAEPSPETVFAPFPSRLRAAIKGPQVILTWIDSPDVKGGYAVYRHSEPMNTGNLEAASRLAVVDSGVQTYADGPGDASPHYYLVLALAEDGSPYQVFIPAKNSTTIAVAAEVPASAGSAAAAVEKPSSTKAAASAERQPEPKSAPPVAMPPAPTPAPAAAARPSEPFADALTASIKGEALILSYKAPAGSRLVLYRGTMPIKAASDLLDATLVSAFADKDGSFADYPVPGVRYYYALLGENDLKAGLVALFPGRNSLAEPVGLKALAQYSGFVEVPPNSRTPPLPYLIPDPASESGGPAAPRDEAPPEKVIAPDTKKAVDSILASAPMLQPPMPTLGFLPEELSSPSGGEDYALSTIVNDRLAARDWESAVDQLRKYLSLNRGLKASARAHFYLGQALAFSGSYRDAFFEFLSARDLYPSDSKAWIEFVLSMLKSSS
jgi:hypothetical protein